MQAKTWAKQPSDVKRDKASETSRLCLRCHHQLTGKLTSAPFWSWAASTSKAALTTTTRADSCKAKITKRPLLSQRVNGHPCQTSNLVTSSLALLVKVEVPSTTLQPSLMQLQVRVEEHLLSSMCRVKHFHLSQEEQPTVMAKAACAKA